MLVVKNEPSACTVYSSRTSFKKLIAHSHSYSIIHRIHTVAVDIYRNTLLHFNRLLTYDLSLRQAKISIKVQTRHDGSRAGRADLNKESTTPSGTGADCSIFSNVFLRAFKLVKAFSLCIETKIITRTTSIMMLHRLRKVSAESKMTTELDRRFPWT